MRVKDTALFGTPEMLRGGTTSPPLHVYRAGIIPPSLKAELLRVRFVAGEVIGIGIMAATIMHTMNTIMMVQTMRSFL
jgi:hypothetical protein